MHPNRRRWSHKNADRHPQEHDGAGVYPKVMIDGDMDAGAWSCGMVAGLIHDIPTVKELIDRIMEEAGRLIARRLTLAAPGLDVEIVKFETIGDTDQTGKLLMHGGKGGAFVAEIREAVRSGRLNAAMHSLKDMPGNEDTPGLVIGATLPRESPADALVLREGLSLVDFRRARGKGFKLGTNAVRRAAYARRLFPEVEVIHFRGAADTRVRKLDAGEMQRLPGGGETGPADALIMARSGLERVGLGGRIAYEFPTREMLPAVGQ